MEMLKHFTNFCKSFRELYSKTDPRILKLEGISPEQLDISFMAKRYFSERVSDMSIDDNANHLQDGRSYGNFLPKWLRVILRF